MPKGIRRIPSKLLGKVLDQGKASAPAVKLLAIKAAEGPNWTLNEAAVKKHYSISRRQFQAGIKLLKISGVLERWQPKHQGFAKERLADAPGHCTLFPESILTEPANVVAFYLAASLSDKPRRPAEIAKRIGMARTATISKIAKRAVAFGCAWNDPGPGRKILIARYDFNFAAYQEQSAENGNLVQIEPSQIDPAQLCKREGNSVREHSTLKETRSDLDDFPKERKSRHATEDFSQHEKRPKGGNPHLDQSLADPMLEDYLNEGWLPSEETVPNFLLAEVIRKGTEGRVGWALLESEGLDTAREIVGALIQTEWNARLMQTGRPEGRPKWEDIDAAIGAFHLLLRQRVGDKPGQRWLNSYDLLVFQLYGIASGAELLDDIGEPLLKVHWHDVRRKQRALEQGITLEEQEAQERERQAEWEALQEKHERERERQREYQRAYRERKKREKMEAKANAA